MTICLPSDLSPASFSRFWHDITLIPSNSSSWYSNSQKPHCAWKYKSLLYYAQYNNYVTIEPSCLWLDIAPRQYLCYCEQCITCFTNLFKTCMIQEKKPELLKYCHRASIMGCLYSAFYKWYFLYYPPLCSEWFNVTWSLVSINFETIVHQFFLGTIAWIGNLKPDML